MEPWYLVPGTRRTADSGTQQVYAPFDHYQARLWCIYWRRPFNVFVNNAAGETRANGYLYVLFPGQACAIVSLKKPIKVSASKCRNLQLRGDVLCRQTIPSW